MHKWRYPFQSSKTSNVINKQHKKLWTDCYFLLLEALADASAHELQLDLTRIQPFQLFLDSLLILNVDQQQVVLTEELFEDVCNIFTVCLEFSKCFSDVKRNINIIPDKLDDANEIENECEIENDITSVSTDHDEAIASTNNNSTPGNNSSSSTNSNSNSTNDSDSKTNTDIRIVSNNNGIIVSANQPCLNSLTSPSVIVTINETSDKNNLSITNNAAAATNCNATNTGCKNDINQITISSTAYIIDKKNLDKSVNQGSRYLLDLVGKASKVAVLCCIQKGKGVAIRQKIIDHPLVVSLLLDAVDRVAISCPASHTMDLLKVLLIVTSQSNNQLTEMACRFRGFERLIEVMEYLSLSNLKDDSESVISQIHFILRTYLRRFPVDFDYREIVHSSSKSTIPKDEVNDSLNGGQGQGLEGGSEQEIMHIDVEKNLGLNNTRSYNYSQIPLNSPTSSSSPVSLSTDKSINDSSEENLEADPHIITQPKSSHTPTPASLSMEIRELPTEESSSWSDVDLCSSPPTTNRNQPSEGSKKGEEPAGVHVFPTLDKNLSQQQQFLKLDSSIAEGTGIGIDEHSKSIHENTNITEDHEKMKKEEKVEEKEGEIFDHIYIPLSLLNKEKKRIDKCSRNAILPFDDNQYNVSYAVLESLDGGSDNLETIRSTSVSTDPVRSLAFIIREQMKKQVNKYCINYDC